MLLSDEEKVDNEEKNIYLNSKLIEESIKLAQTIDENDQFAIKIAKSLINKSRDIDIDSGLTIERFGCALCFTNNNRNDMKSFLDK